MTYMLKRITTAPASPLRILVDNPMGDGDAGLAVGGSFMFSPAGEDGDSAQVGEAAAAAIMGDRGLAVHFSCTPPWKPAGAVDAADSKPAKGRDKA